MDAWKYEIISRVEQDISLVRFAYWSTLEINNTGLHPGQHSK